MAKAPDGQDTPHSAAINNALNDPNSTLEQLKKLREMSERTVMNERGDIAPLLKRLKAEIDRRRGTPG